MNGFFLSNSSALASYTSPPRPLSISRLKYFQKNIVPMKLKLLTEMADKYNISIDQAKAIMHDTEEQIALNQD